MTATSVVRLGTKAAAEYLGGLPESTLRYWRYWAPVRAAIALADTRFAISRPGCVGRGGSCQDRARGSG